MREYYPGALVAFEDLAHGDALGVLGRAPLHKRRNTAEHLPDNEKEWIDAKLAKAFGHPRP